MNTDLFKDLPTKKYTTIVVDTPWAYTDKLGSKQAVDGNTTGMYGGVRSAEAHYGTLTIPEVATLPIPDLAEKNAHLYVWVTNAFMDEAYDLIKGWGFKPKTIVTWVKTRNGIVEAEKPEDCAFGMGFYYRNMTEHAILAVRGSLKPLSHSIRNVVFAPRGEHSAKPNEAYEVFASVSPGPRLDMFARQPREGFELWGNQAEIVV